MWDVIAPENLRPPSRYAWYCRRARDLIEQFDQAIWQVKGEHVPVPENFWAFEDRHPIDDPDWNEKLAFGWDQFGMTREQSVAHYHRRWRDNPELDEIWHAGSAIVTADIERAMEAERQASGHLALEDIELEDCETDISAVQSVTPHPDWKKLQYVTFLWGPTRCGKTFLAEIIGWMMHNMADDKYEFAVHKFGAPPDSIDSAPLLFEKLIEEIGVMKNRVILLDGFMESLPDPSYCEQAATVRRWIVRQLSIHVRKGSLKYNLQSNRSLLVITSRDYTHEDFEELQGSLAHYYLRPPLTNLERKEVDRLRGEV